MSNLTKLTETRRGVWANEAGNEVWILDSQAFQSWSKVASAASYEGEFPARGTLIGREWVFSSSSTIRMLVDQLAYGAKSLPTSIYCTGFTIESAVTEIESH